MDHIAILRKDWGLLLKILSGEKTIESRWYQTKKAPWNKVRTGDTIYFKNSGQKVEIKAEVEQVLQYEIKDVSNLRSIVDEYGDKICLVNRDIDSWSGKLKYCILVFFKNVEKLEETFDIDKTGFGISVAWLVVDDVSRIKK